MTGYTQNADGSYSLNISPFGSSNPSKPVLSTTSSVAGDRRIYFQSYVDYMNKFGNHNVSGMLLWNIDQYDNNAPGNLVASLPPPKMGFCGVVFSYDYDNRYMFEVNAGYNGSEKTLPKDINGASSPL